MPETGAAATDAESHSTTTARQSVCRSVSSSRILDFSSSISERVDQRPVDMVINSFVRLRWFGLEIPILQRGGHLGRDPHDHVAERASILSNNRSSTLVVRYAVQADAAIQRDARGSLEPDLRKATARLDILTGGAAKRGEPSSGEELAAGTETAALQVPVEHG